jgi:hypothetical protein
MDSHVVILGDHPGDKLEDQLIQALGVGEPVALPEDVLEHLMQRRRAAQNTGSWVEGHYRPGLPKYLPKRRK